MAKKTIMRAFKINEISAVDRPAQAHAKMTLMKRDNAPHAMSVPTLPVTDQVGAIVKFMVPSVQLVDERAIAKDMYGVSRFADLIQSINYLMQSCEDESEREADNSPVPGALRRWLKDGTDVFRAMADEEVRELITAVNAYSKADMLIKAGYSYAEISANSEILAGMSPDELTKALAADLGDAQSKDAIMPETVDDLKKKLAAQTIELAKAKARAKDKKWLGAQTPPLSDEDAGDFLAMSEAERDKKIAANPIKEESGEGTEKAVSPEIAKALAENEDMKKRLATLEDEREGLSFAKRAAGLGLLESHGVVLRKAYAGDKDYIVKLEAIIKGLTAQIETGKLFDELGTSQSGAATTAKAELDQKAIAFREGQSAIGKSLSVQQAFTKVYTDPANAALKKRFDAEESAAKRG